MPGAPTTEALFRNVLGGALATYGWHPPMALPKQAAQAKVPPVPKAVAAPAAPDFVSSVLKGIGAPVNTNTTQALRDWMAAEGGPTDNPLNTTLGQSGAQGSAIKGYGSTQAGINATVKTLNNGLYGSVISALKSSNPTAVRRAVVGSPWSGNHYAGTDYAKGLVNAPNPPSPKAAAKSAAGRAATPGAPAVPGTPGFTIAAFNGNPNNQPTRSQALTSALLASGGRGLSMSAVLNAAQYPTSYPASTPARTVPGIPGMPAIPGTPGVTPTQAVDGSKAMPNSEFARMVSSMNQIAGHNYNYEWGGGHNPSFSPTSGSGHGSGSGVGYDCSGAISAILHAAGKLSQPMVAQQFMSYGQAGPGGKNDLTIYASPTHVFAELDGKFFGTSMSNPGGGAGWFQRAETAGYTIRHVSLQGAPAVHMTGQGGLVPFRQAA